MILKIWTKLHVVRTVAGSSVAVKTEADSNDITECPHDDEPTTGEFSWFDIIYELICDT